MGESLRERMAKMRAERPTKSQRKLLDYFAGADMRMVSHYPISAIARELDIADATVLRFCRALGFGGYRDFRMALAAEDVPHEGYLSYLVQSFGGEVRACGEHLEEQSLQMAAEMILKARTVCCLGMGASFFAAAAIHERLLKLGAASFCERDATLCELFIASRGPADVLLAFGSDVRTERCIALARARGMRAVMAAGESARSELTLIRAGDEDHARMLFAVEALTITLEQMDSV